MLGVNVFNIITTVNPEYSWYYYGGRKHQSDQSKTTQIACKKIDDITIEVTNTTRPVAHTTMQAGRSRVLQFRLQTSPEQWEQNVAGRAIDDTTVEATNTIRPVEKITVEGGTQVV